MSIFPRIGGGVRITDNKERDALGAGYSLGIGGAGDSHPSDGDGCQGSERGECAGSANLVLMSRSVVVARSASGFRDTAHLGLRERLPKTSRSTARASLMTSPSISWSRVERLSMTFV